MPVRREILEVLGEFKRRPSVRIGYNIMAPHVERGRVRQLFRKSVGGGNRDTHVKIRDGLSWIDDPTNHLEKLVNRDAIAHARQ